MVAALRQTIGELAIETPDSGLHDITQAVVLWLEGQAVTTGLLTLFCQHTSASLLIQENAAPSARRDLESYFSRIAPESEIYDHDDEGADDMPAHLRAALTQTHLAIPVGNGAPMLGTWQGIYLFEHRRRPHQRTIALHLVGS